MSDHRREGGDSSPGPWVGTWRSARAFLIALIRWLRRHLRGFYAAAGALLTMGLALALLVLWALSGLTEGVMEGETIRFDRAVLLWMDARATPELDVAALVVTALGDTLVVVSASLNSPTIERNHGALRPTPPMVLPTTPSGEGR